MRCLFILLNSFTKEASTPNFRCVLDLLSSAVGALSLTDLRLPLFETFSYIGAELRAFSIKLGLASLCPSFINMCCRISVWSMLVRWLSCSLLWRAETFLLFSFLRISALTTDLGSRWARLARMLQWFGSQKATVLRLWRYNRFLL